MSGFWLITLSKGSRRRDFDSNKYWSLRNVLKFDILQKFKILQITKIIILFFKNLENNDILLNFENIQK